MRAFYDARQLAHAPKLELHNGGFVPFAETPRGLKPSSRRRRGRTRGSIMARRRCAPSTTRPISPSSGWRTRTGAAAGREGDASGYAWPVVRRRPLDLDRIDAKLGLTASTRPGPIAEGTWEGAYWSAQTALTALDAVLAGDRAAFALCRPPGHHAGADYLGGYCYLNNAAIAAEAATARRPARSRSSTSTIIMAMARRTSSTRGTMCSSRRPRRPSNGLSLFLGSCRRDR